MVKRRLSWEFEYEIMDALNRTNKTDCNYMMFGVKILSQKKEILGFGDNLDPTVTTYEIKVLDKDYNEYKMVFKYGINSKIDHFDVISIDKVKL